MPHSVFGLEKISWGLNFSTDQNYDVNPMYIVYS